MKRYVQRDAKCCKCGYGNIKDRYKNGYPEDINLIDDHGGMPLDFKPAESIERTCIHCGYVWNEDPLNLKY